MAFHNVQCVETVSVVEAVIFGSGEACISIGLGSLLGGVTLFILVVVVLRYIGARLLLSALSKRSAKDNDRKEVGLKPMPYESPIKSTGAWDSRAR